MCPSLEVLGGSAATQNELLLSGVYVEQGATAFDEEDGDITSQIDIDNSAVDTSTPGVYPVSYRIVDSSGCEVTATRFVRVIALVPTSDAADILVACRRRVNRVDQLCDVGNGNPNPASFPGCCLAVSDMDSASCFCDDEVLDTFAKRDATFVEKLVDFVPLACGFRIKYGDEICEDRDALSAFLKLPAERDVRDRSNAWKRVIDEDSGRLKEDLTCGETVQATRYICRKVTSSESITPVIADIAPCCDAAFALNRSNCLCDAVEDERKGTELFEDTAGAKSFLRKLVGFTPLGCGFDISEQCPKIRERIGVPVTEMVRNVTQFINETRLIPVAVGVPLLVSEGDITGVDVVEEGVLEQLSGGLSAIDQRGNQIRDEMFREFFDRANYQNCLNYTDAIEQTCTRVVVSDETTENNGVDTTTYDVTACCGVLYSLWTRGCLCPPFAEQLLSTDLYLSLFKIAPEACGFSMDEIPNDNRDVCVNDLSETLEGYVESDIDARFDWRIIEDAESWVSEKYSTTKPSDFQNIFLVEGGSTIGGFGVGFDFEAFTNATAWWIPSSTFQTNVSVAIPSASTCYAAVRAAEDSCVPNLAGASEIFFQDLDWQMCCRRLRVVENAKCFCDGFVSLLLTADSPINASAADTDIVSKIHAAVLSEAPSACGFIPTYGSTCPAAEFTETVDEKLAVDSRELVDVETFYAQKNEVDYSPLAYISARTFYSEDPNTIIRGLMLSNGGMLISELDIIGGETDREARLVIVSPPRLKNQGVTVLRDAADGQVSLEYTTWNTSSTYRILVELSDTPGSFFLDSTSQFVRIGDGTATFEAGLFSGATSATIGASESALTVTSSGKLFLRTFESPEGIEVEGEEVTLPDGTVAKIVRVESFDESMLFPLVRTSAIIVANETLTAEETTTTTTTTSPIDIRRGVVKRSGVIVPKEEDGGVCSDARSVKNFLAIALESPTLSKKYSVVGALTVADDTDKETILVPEIKIPIYYVPRGGEVETEEFTSSFYDESSFVDPLTPGVGTCLGIQIIDGFGRRYSDEDLCARTSSETTSFGVQFTILDVEMCRGCAVTGRESDGALFEVSHGDGEDSNALAVSEPFIRRPFCELNDFEEVAPEQQQQQQRRRRNLLQFFGGVPFFQSPRVISPSNQMAGNMPGGANNQFAAGNSGAGGDALLPSTTVNVSQGPPTTTLCSEEALKDIESSIYWKDDRGAITSSINGGNGFTEQYESYAFAGDIRNPDKNNEVSLKNALTLVALSPWLRENLGDGTYGAWRRINDPSRELKFTCYGYKIVSYNEQGDEIVQITNPRCENVQFYASLSAPVSLSGGGGGSESTTQFSQQQEGSSGDSIPPAYVVLIEVDFGVILCEGCYLKPLYVDDDILFSIFPNNEVISEDVVDNNIGSSYYTFDFVGPTIAERIECSSPKGALVTAVELVAPDAAAITPLDDDDGEEEDAPAPSVRKLPNRYACNAQANTNFKGVLLNDGNKNILSSAAACCDACATTENCDIWVYCVGDCVDFAFHSCWLKKSMEGGFNSTASPSKISAWDRGDGVPWTSGYLVTKQDDAGTATGEVSSSEEEVTDTAKYFTLEPGKPTDIPASTITVKAIDAPVTPPSLFDNVSDGVETLPPPTTSLPTDEEPVIASPPPTGFGTIRPTVPVDVPTTTTTTTPTPTIPPTTDEVMPPTTATTPSPPSSSKCSNTDVAACPRESSQTLEALDIRANFRASTKGTSPSDEGRQLTVSGTAVNFGALGTVCLAGVTFRVPFEFLVIPETNEQAAASPEPRRAPSSEFLFDCAFLGVRSRTGPITDDPNTTPRECTDVLKLTFVDDEENNTNNSYIQFTLRDVALCPDCWLVGGKGGVIFSVRHRENLKLLLARRDDGEFINTVNAEEVACEAAF